MWLLRWKIPFFKIKLTKYEKRQLPHLGSIRTIISIGRGGGHRDRPAAFFGGVRVHRRRELDVGATASACEVVFASTVVVVGGGAADAVGGSTRGHGTFLRREFV